MDETLPLTNVEKFLLGLYAILLLAVFGWWFVIAPTESQMSIIGAVIAVIFCAGMLFILTFFLYMFIREVVLLPVAVWKINWMRKMILFPFSIWKRK